MYALKVRINDGPPIVGGADDLGVLNAIVNCAGKLGLAAVSHRRDETPDFFVSLGGLTSRAPGATNEHLNWLSQIALKPGDRVTVEIIETDTADRVISGVEAEKHQSDEHEYFEHCKRIYFSMRSKYEPEA